MKKKIISLCLVLALALTAIGGATLAYFTDTDSADNVFTVGNVKIDLIEQQRGDPNKEGKTQLEDFEQSKHLYPIVGSAQDKKDEHCLPIAKNYVDKVVTVKNEGSEEAWVRAYFAIPSALDDGYETFNAGLNVLHFNFGKYYDEAGKEKGTEDKEWSWKHGEGENVKWNYYETTIDGIAYNVYFADYYKPLAANATTERLINGVYLDETFNYEVVKVEEGDKVIEKGQYFVMRENKITNQMEKKVLELDEKWNWSNVTCPVFAVAVQAAGFDSVDAAVTEAFGAQYNPWGGTVTNWQ